MIWSKELKIWNDWANSFPNQKNQWSDFNEDGRRAWLNVVKNDCRDEAKNHKEGDQEFILDGTYITDYVSFFCAIGEAINGQGGYYGFDINSMIDCFHGGYGTRGKFTLVWTKHHIAKENLVQQSWLDEINYRKLKNKNLLNETVFEEIGDGVLFKVLMETMQSHQINIVLS